MRRLPSDIRVRHIDQAPSTRADLTTRVIRWLCRKPLDLSEPRHLVRLRSRTALLDRVGGWLGTSRVEGARWHRACIRGVRARVMHVSADPAPRASGEASVLLYLHGGAFLVRALNGHMALAQRIAQGAGLREAWIPLYRLAPEHPFPAAVDDCFAAYEGLLRSGVAPHRIVVAGDSAGGGLVLKLMMRLRDLGLPQPACGLLLSPFTDMSCSGRSIETNAAHDPMFGKLPCMNVRYYLGRLAADDPRCSPVFGEFHALPPLFAQVGSTERLLDDTMRLAPRVRRGRGRLEIEVWKDMPHVWHVIGLPESGAAIARLADFARRELDRAERDRLDARRAA